VVELVDTQDFNLSAPVETLEVELLKFGEAFISLWLTGNPEPSPDNFLSGKV
jgi:hypothetical protein